MNGAHLHLLVNHVSIFALLIGTVALAVAMKRKSAELRILATSLFVVAGLFAWVAVETGEKAEDVVLELDRGSDPLIEQHEQSAAWALRSGVVVGALALALEWAARQKQRWVRTLQWTLLVFAVHGCTVFVATALLGGKIRHTEIRSESVSAPPGNRVASVVRGTGL